MSVPFLELQTFDWAAEISGAIKSLLQIQDSPQKFRWVPSYVKIIFGPQNIEIYNLGKKHTSVCNIYLRHNLL